ncbi:hypothetical protein [Cellulomonas hominis]
MTAATIARRAAGALLGAGLAAAALTSTATAAGAADDLIDVSPAAVTVQAPAPGHSHEWTMSVTNVTDSAVPLWIEVAGHDGALFTGDAPLELTLRDPAGATILYTADVGEMLGTTVALPDLPAGSTYVVTGAAALPASAGNEYLTADGDLSVRFTALAEDVAPGQGPTDDSGVLAAGDPPAGRLPWTGVEPTAALLTALALIGAGLTVVLGRRPARRARRTS